MAKEGIYEEGLVPIFHNVYDIPERLKEIDEDYFVMFNIETQHFEVHNSRQRVSTYCFTVTWDELDSRTLDYARETSMKNAQKIISMIRARNAKREQDRKNRFHDELDWKVSEAYQYLQRHATDELPKDPYKLRWV